MKITFATIFFALVQTSVSIRHPCMRAFVHKKNLFFLEISYSQHAQTRSGKVQVRLSPSSPSLHVRDILPRALIASKTTTSPQHQVSLSLFVAVHAKEEEEDDCNTTSRISYTRVRDVHKNMTNLLLTQASFNKQRTSSYTSYNVPNIDGQK